MKQPKRPVWIGYYNRLINSHPIDGEKLLIQALQKERVSNYKENDFKEGYFNLIRAINDEAKLHPLGQFMIKNRTVNLLRNRLKVEKILNEYPEIYNIPIDDPIVITGLARTGSTFLHRALSRHSGIRTCKSWEVMHPVPFTNDKQGNKRKRNVQWTTRFLHHISPDFSRVHPTFYDEPEEEVLLLDLTFQNTVNEALMHIPSYVEWANSRSMHNAFTYLKKVLKILLWQEKKSRLLLKTPAYMEDLAAFQEVFPKAKIIHTCRDPLKVMPSFCNLIYYTRSMFSDSVDPKTIGTYFLKRNAEKVKTALPLLEKSSVYHLSYEELIQEPLQKIKAIIEFTGLPFAPFQLKKIKHYVNQQSRFKGLKYNLADFGLERKMVKEMFISYDQLCGST